MKNKLRMVLGVAALGTALLAMPAPASAGGPHVDPAGVAFTAEGGSFSLTNGSGFPIVCSGPNLLVGNFDAGSNTTGEISVDYTNCQVSGFTYKCHSVGAALLNTISVKGIRFQTVYTSDSKSDLGLLLTLPSSIFAPAVQLSCEGLGTVEVKGSFMGRITAPKCGESSSSATLAFTATGNKQNQMQITGTGQPYDLEDRLGSNAWTTAAVTTTTTLAFKEKATWTCL